MLVPPMSVPIIGDIPRPFMAMEVTSTELGVAQYWLCEPASPSGVMVRVVPLVAQVAVAAVGWASRTSVQVQAPLPLQLLRGCPVGRAG
jgi:hypothetical protein